MKDYNDKVNAYIFCVAVMGVLLMAGVVAVLVVAV